MPSEIDTVLQRAKSVLVRLDSELAQFKGDKLNYNKNVQDSTHLLQQITDSGPALMNIAKFRHMVINVKGAYRANAINLEESAEMADDTAGKSRALAVLYGCVMLSKMMDIIAAMTGTGKWITSAKTAVVDEVESLQKQNTALYAAQGANLTLLGDIAQKDLLGGTAKNMIKLAGDLQGILSAFIELVKAGRNLINAPESLKKVKGDLHLWSIQIEALVSDGLNALQRLTKLYDEYLILAKKMPKVPTPKVIPASDWWGDPRYQMRMTDYFAAVKAGIDAIKNLHLAFVSFMQMRADAAAAAEARGLAQNQMTLQGTGGIPFELDIRAWVGLTEADMISAIHFVNSAPDAAMLNDDLRILARQFTQKAENTRMLVANAKSRLQPALDQMTVSAARLMATDAELAELRERVAKFAFQIEGPNKRNSDSENMRSATFAGYIDMERRKIAEALASKN
jgi:hypothetical protein